MEAVSDALLVSGALTGAQFSEWYTQSVMSFFLPSSSVVAAASLVVVIAVVVVALHSVTKTFQRITNVQCTFLSQYYYCYIKARRDMERICKLIGTYCFFFNFLRNAKKCNVFNSYSM